MFERVPTGEPWIILYADGDKRKADSIKDDVVILPAEQYFDELAELERYRMHSNDVTLCAVDACELLHEA